MPLKVLSRNKLTTRTVTLLLIIAFALVLGLSMLEPLAVFSLPGLLVIVLGTFGAAVLSHSLESCIAAFKQFLGLKKKEPHNIANEANIVLHFAQLWFRNQYIQIDRDLEKLDRPFLKKGLQMIRDRQSNDDILALLNWQISQINAKEKQHVRVLQSMANFAPLFGIVGTILALVNVVYMLEQGVTVSQAAGPMGFALISTLYGLLLANFCLKPMVARLEANRIEQVQYVTLLAEGIIQIHEKRTPAVIRETLVTYIESMNSRSSEQGGRKENQQKSKKPMLVKFGLQRSS